jgi:hypothetical protein
MISSEQLQKAITYSDYLQVNQDLMKAGKTTGSNQSAEFVEYARVNLVRMLRLDKTLTLLPTIASNLQHLKTPHTLLVITEGWCGDSAQIVPVFAKMEAACPALKLLFLFRDEHLDLMDQYLTKGARSIPKVICFETESGQEKWTWGPRPQALQAEVEKLLQQHVSKEEKGLFVQSWYNHNKTEATQNEINTLIQSLL